MTLGSRISSFTSSTINALSVDRKADADVLDWTFISRGAAIELYEESDPKII